MKAFEVVIENETEEEGSPIPNNQIWYTATAKIESYWDNVFGANIVSNTWDSESGKGVITFDSDVTKIGTEAFYQCSDLTSVTLPDEVTTIGDNAFYYCTKLESVTIPESVTKIGTSAFSSCSKLKYVYCKPTTPPSIGLYGGEFSNNASGRKFYVPQGSVDTYKSAGGWSNYASYIVGNDL